jgi:hypothetical protein
MTTPEPTRQRLATLPQTVVDGLTVFHPETTQLGPGVGEAVVQLIRQYAERASLCDLPPITLSGAAWGQPWEMVAPMWCAGEAGPSDDEVRTGADYRCLALHLIERCPPKSSPPPAHPEDVEGTLAHEIVHLRWWRLRHGEEFSARVRALLRGATFPPHSGWSAATRRVMATTRREMQEWLEGLLGGGRRRCSNW